MKTPEDILDNMLDIVPYKIAEEVQPYIIEAIKEYHKQYVELPDFHLSIKGITELLGKDNLKIIKLSNKICFINYKSLSFNSNVDELKSHINDKELLNNFSSELLYNRTIRKIYTYYITGKYEY